MCFSILPFSFSIFALVVGLDISLTLFTSFLVVIFKLFEVYVKAKTETSYDIAHFEMVIIRGVRDVNAAIAQYDAHPGEL
jgi:hypothetical protein